MKTLVFSRVQSTSDGFMIQDENFHGIHWKKKSEFPFYFIVYTTMHASDVITNVTKQNMNDMA